MSMRKLGFRKFHLKKKKENLKKKKEKRKFVLFNKIYASSLQYLSKDLYIRSTGL